ncbi:unnamed protein product [Effrenium voratum]|nr:unnamed protein product [Effrenium voratum]
MLDSMQLTQQELGEAYFLSWQLESRKPNEGPFRAIQLMVNPHTSLAVCLICQAVALQPPSQQRLLKPTVKSNGSQESMRQLSLQRSFVVHIGKLNQWTQGRPSQQNLKGSSWRTACQLCG